MKKHRTYSALSVAMIFALFVAVASPIVYGIAEAAGATWQCRYCGHQIYTGNANPPRNPGTCYWGENKGNPHVLERIK